MPRIIRLTATGPLKLEPREKPYFVCACGLSQTFPLCDGSHKACATTEPDPTATYIYEDDRKTIREVVREGDGGSVGSGGCGGGGG